MKPLEKRDETSAKGLSGFAGSFVRFRGRLWFHSEGDDYGLVVDVTVGIAPRIASIPAHAFFDLDMSCELDGPRPPNAVIAPVTAERFHDFPEPCTRLGAVWVQTRFVEAVKSLPSYRDVRWFAPNRPNDGDVHGLVAGQVVAMIAPVSRWGSLAHNDRAMEA